MNLTQYDRYHFIGIGGISMSGLAQMLRRMGHEVTGSDRVDSPMLDKLRAEGIVCYVGHEAHQVDHADAVVYTAAVPADNCEMVRARELGIPLIYRGDLLGAWMRGYEKRVGICGTHGKSSTTSMLATILVDADRDPSVHIGTELDLIGGTTRLGESEIFITESCEYQDSFLDLFPTAAVVLNIEEDHLDYFSGLDAIKASFARFMDLCPENGTAILNGDDPNCLAAAEIAGRSYVTFGFGEDCDYRALNARPEKGLYVYDLSLRGKVVSSVRLGVPGRHHVYNSLAAIAAAAYCGVEASLAGKLVENYRGAARRFDRAGECCGAPLYHDYAHHPTEIRATLSSARDTVGEGEIWCVFQPHTYSRTKALFSDFASAFDEADHVLLADIYAAREPDPGDIHASMVAQEATRRGHKDARYAGSMDTIAETLKKQVRPGDLVLILGAGDIIKIVPMLVD